MVRLLDHQLINVTNSQTTLLVLYLTLDYAPLLLLKKKNQIDPTVSIKGVKNVSAKQLKQNFITQGEAGLNWYP